ncbi:MAG: hypothetical protein ABI409_02910 [Ramlibacter sp.]
MFKRLLIAFLLVCAGHASAMMPENGVWWNPAESGTGYDLELQDNVLVMYAYTYEASGAPVYLYAAMRTSGENQFAGSLTKSSNGPCITCPYRANTEAPVGNVQIAFDSPSTATLNVATADGTRSTRLQRFAFAINEASPYKVLGEWALVTGSFASPIYSGDRIGFGSTFVNSDGGYLMASGTRTGAPSNGAIARQQTDGTWYILVDTSPGFYDFYSFRFSGLNTMEGRVWTFPKTGAISGGGNLFVGLRTGSATSVATSSGPTLQKLASLTNMAGYESNAAVKAQTSSADSLDPAVALMLDKARQAFQQMTRP